MVARDIESEDRVRAARADLGAAKQMLVSTPFQEHMAWVERRAVRARLDLESGSGTDQKLRELIGELRAYRIVAGRMARRVGELEAVVKGASHGW